MAPGTRISRKPKIGTVSRLHEIGRTQKLSSASTV